MSAHSPLPPNRSMVTSTITPVLAYPNVRDAVQWLSKAFGFEERLQIGDHRAQLSLGDAAIVVTVRLAGPMSAAGGPGHSVMVRVADVASHYAQAQRAEARILSAPADYPYGERQYSVEDPGGHCWTFSQSIADIDPASWGGKLLRPG
ncbi:VOC family protein [Chitinimonas naiadis]